MVSGSIAHRESPRILRITYPSASYIIYILQDQWFCLFILALLVFHSVVFHQISGFLFILIKGKTRFFSILWRIFTTGFTPERPVHNGLWFSLNSAFCWDYSLNKLTLSVRESLGFQWDEYFTTVVGLFYVYFGLSFCYATIH